MKSIDQHELQRTACLQAPSQSACYDELQTSYIHTTLQARLSSRTTDRYYLLSRQPVVHSSHWQMPPKRPTKFLVCKKKDFSRPTNWPTSDVVITQQGISASGVVRPEQRQPLGALPPGQLCSLRTHHVPNL